MSKAKATHSNSLEPLELPLGKRTLGYRLLEMMTPILTYTMLALAVILSIVDDVAGAVYVLALVLITFIKGLAVMVSTFRGHKQIKRALLVDWHQRLIDLETGDTYHHDASDYRYDIHLANVKNYNDQVLAENFPRVNDIYNLVIIAAYNEEFGVIDRTMASLRDTTFNKQRMVICLAYEERGGDAINEVAKKLQKKWRSVFADFVIVQHPKGLPGEVIGKGGNITFSGRKMSEYFAKKGVLSSNVIVTTLDSDNKPHFSYFDYLTYEYITRVERKNLSYQPIALFVNNIWDVPAPIRVVSACNSFWNIVCTVRPHALRNFAAHSQPLDALEDMDFWSVRTIVEDGHQYWRSFFHFRGHYSVIPIQVPVYQDSVTGENYRQILKAQYIQLRRWAYGVSDVPFVIVNFWHLRKQLPIGRTMFKLYQLIEGHILQVIISIIIAIGGWMPLIFSSKADRSFVAHELPKTLALVQQIAMVGLIVSVAVYINILPPRPRRHKRRRAFGMVFQWVLLPITSIVYSSMTALYSQTRLLLGKYYDKFDVTSKSVVDDS